MGFLLGGFYRWVGQTRINSKFAWFGAITRLKSRPALGCLHAAPSSALGFFPALDLRQTDMAKSKRQEEGGGILEVEAWYDDPRRDSFNVHHDR